MRGSLDRIGADLRAMVRWIATASPGASVLELPGVSAGVTPAAAERSTMNSVVYDDAAALAAALPALEEGYERGGIVAWTVWVPDSDREAAELLARAGHVLDAEPLAMELELSRLEPAPAPGDWTREGDVADVARINDDAYAFEPRSFERAFARLGGEAVRAYVARLDGRAASCVVTIDRSDSCGVALVATLPDARGRGLATGLMSQALLDARERGLAFSTLQATRMGAPVYERLGYRSAGRLQMWERRRRASAP